MSTICPRPTDTSFWSRSTPPIVYARCSPVGGVRGQYFHFFSHLQMPLPRGFRRRACSLRSPQIPSLRVAPGPGRLIGFRNSPVENACAENVGGLKSHSMSSIAARQRQHHCNVLHQNRSRSGHGCDGKIAASTAANLFIWLCLSGNEVATVAWKPTASSAVNQTPFQWRWDGGPGQSRTADQRFRKPLLYPSELQGPIGHSSPLSQIGAGCREAASHRHCKSKWGVA